MSSEALKFSDLAKVFPVAETKLKPMQMASSGGVKDRILVGDDDPVFTLTIFQTLVEAGYEIVVAENGTDAIAELRKPDYPPVAILDWKMAGMDGIEICGRMRDAEKNVYLILNREEVTTEDLVHGLEMGADLYLPKTVPPQELIAHVKAGLRRIKQQRALAQKLEELSGGRLTTES